MTEVAPAYGTDPFKAPPSNLVNGPAPRQPSQPTPAPSRAAPSNPSPSVPAPNEPAPE